MTTDRVTARTLGILWLIYGCSRIAGFAFLLIYSNTLRLMWGALLVRVPNALPWMAFFHVALAIVMAWCVVCAILAFAAGLAILSRSGTARGLSMTAALVSLPEWPFGIVLGVYTLVSLASLPPARPQPLQTSSPPRPMTPLLVRESR